MVRFNKDYLEIGEHKINYVAIIEFILICVLVVLAYNIGHYDAIQYYNYINQYCSLCPCAIEQVYGYIPNTTINISIP